MFHVMILGVRLQIFGLPELIPGIGVPRCRSKKCPGSVFLICACVGGLCTARPKTVQKKDWKA
ncbi:hypothetical protein E2C01_063491 [Portunus trituberculatus]|uniref:Uncharacterized protein n=1 Tax=Portunus trituberculatus TaxID=210409 RepID=A0A5B7HGI1_PORTR|nr:hypothetical protein [Portunus trituberculatus]